MATVVLECQHHLGNFLACSAKHALMFLSGLRLPLMNVTTAVRASNEIAPPPDRHTATLNYAIPIIAHSRTSKQTFRMFIS